VSPWVLDPELVREILDDERLAALVHEVPHGDEAHCAVIAPSATSTVPVTNDDSSDARNSATFAISRGSPGRPIGWNDSIVA
jgi:hypothetical protein